MAELLTGHAKLVCRSTSHTSSRARPNFRCSGGALAVAHVDDLLCGLPESLELLRSQLLHIYGVRPHDGNRPMKFRFLVGVLVDIFLGSGGKGVQHTGRASFVREFADWSTAPAP